MAIVDDFSVAVNGDIRHSSGTTNYTVLAFHRYLGDLADDAQAAGDDLIDITTETPSDRSTDEIITLNPPFNIDDTAARFLFDGSITQAGGDTQYSGLRVLGSVVAGTEIMIIQDHNVLPAYWGTGINADAANNVIMRLLIKSRSLGADIDGKRINTLTRELGDQYKEFSVTLGLANSVSALSTADDGNNASTDTAIEAFSTITNTEGQRLLDIDNNAVDEEYYSEWNIGSQSLNDVYERTKWISQRSHNADASVPTGTTNFVVDNATILGQGHELSARGQAEKLTEMVFRIKNGGGTPTGTLIAELFISDDATPGIPTGSVLATSVPVLASQITSTYANVKFRFNDNITMTASEDYFAVITNAAGTSANFFHVEGTVVAGDDNGTRAELTGGWAGQTNDNLIATIKSSPIHHAQPGEKFRGITHEIIYDGESGGPFTENATLFWGTRITYDGDAGVFDVGNYVEFQPTGGGAKKNGGKILFDDVTGNVLYVALEDITANLLDNDLIQQIGGSAASAVIATTIVDQNRAGGEGILLALDDNGAAGDFYIQLISGSPPVDNLRISETLTRFALVATTVNSRTISPEYIGATTGTNITGAYGIGFETADVGASDKFTAFDNVQRSPPNNVTFTVTGLVSGEDRVLIGPRSGSTLTKNQLTTDTTLSGATETLIQCSTAIPTDTPSSGTGTDNTRVRVELDSGIYRRVQYDSFTANDFTITTADDDWTGSGISTTPKDVFVAYIDVLCDATSEAYTAVYKGTDNEILVRVRDGGATPIKTFEGNGVFGSTSSSLAAIRTTDA